MKNGDLCYSPVHLRVSVSPVLLSLGSDGHRVISERTVVGCEEIARRVITWWHELDLVQHPRQATGLYGQSQS